MGSGFVSAPAQVTADMLLRQSLARTQKSPPQTATIFVKTLQPIFREGFPALLHSRKSAIGLSVLIRGRLKRKGVWQNDKGHPELNPRSRFHFSATIFLPKRLLRTGNYGKKIVGRKMKTQTWAYLRGFLWPYISAPHFSAETPASLEPGDK